MSQKTVNDYLLIKQKIAAEMKVLAQMRKEEKRLKQGIQQYLNETGQEGIRIDANTVITLVTDQKNIPVSRKAYRLKLESLLKSKGIYQEQLVDDILNAKIQDTIQEQKLKMAKTRRSWSTRVALYSLINSLLLLIL